MAKALGATQTMAAADGNDSAVIERSMSDAAA
jgi:hypothetical protein